MDTIRLTKQTTGAVPEVVRVVPAMVVVPLVGWAVGVLAPVRLLQHLPAATHLFSTWMAMVSKPQAPETTPLFCLITMPMA
ncbi:MAG: hypothetical protein H7837_08575 [Magnetococcus sp. MYC-9]